MYCGFRLGGSSVPIVDSDPNATQDFRALLRNDDDAPNAPKTDGPPLRMGIYRIGRQLGSGGMGSVYEAESEETGERVAVKILSEKLASNTVSVERFRQEGRLASQISHPRCVFVFGADTDAGRPFIVMELMPGSTLKDLVDQRGPLPIHEAMIRILDVIEGLMEAHRIGVIHRDVKPSNCFLTLDDRVKVGDFGLSKSLGGSNSDKQLTHTGAFLGTVLFASPEQIRGEEIGYDSDVYSVCATLYFLLTGAAPFQHESITAALAKVISEPAPRVRAKRPDVPRAIDRINVRGLERDRTRRWATLEDLRDALYELLPSVQRPALPRALAGAYIIDSLILSILMEIPLEVSGWGAELRSQQNFTNTAVNSSYWLLLWLYFSVQEGIVGTTLGKWLLGLQVCRDGQIGPPGFRAAAIRTLVFIPISMLIFTLPAYFWKIPAVGPIIAIAGVVAGLGIFLYPFWRRTDSRGVHDLASGCRVVHRLRPVKRVRLQSQFPDPLDTDIDTRIRPPEMVASFHVIGTLPVLPNGEQVWIAEDRSLARRILIWIQPSHASDDSETLPQRPTRLRMVSCGGLLWNGGTYSWIAFVAPVGMPLVDTVTPQSPHDWPTTRVILEQVTEEARQLSEVSPVWEPIQLEQLWVEPAGRLYFLPFAMPSQQSPVPPADSALGFIRQVVTLSLEGVARTTPGHIYSPIPLHATEVLNKLCDQSGPKVPSVAEFQNLIRETHIHPSRVTTSNRAAHVGIITALAAPIVIWMMIFAIGFVLLSLITTVSQAQAKAKLAAGLRDSEVLEQWQNQNTQFNKLIRSRDPNTLADTIDQQAAHLRAIAADDAKYVSPIELSLYNEWKSELQPTREELLQTSAREMTIQLQSANLERFDESERTNRGKALAIGGFAQLGIFWLGFGLFAFVFRGGISYQLAGLTLVRATGQPAGRFRSFFRELLIWPPLFGLLASLLWLSALHPEAIMTRLVLSVSAVVLILVYVILGIRYPGRLPHDRIMGTYVVPR